MSKAVVLQLVADLSRGRADPGSCEKYYEDLTYELAKQGQITNAAILPTIEGTATYAFPNDAVDLITVVYDSIQLTKSPRQPLEWRTAAWRDRRGMPSEYIVEDEAARTFRLYPTPDVASKDAVWSGPTLGTDYPEGSVMALYQQKRTDVPEYFDLYLACEILSREFKRESDHRDLKFAEAAEQLSRLFYTMVTTDG